MIKKIFVVAIPLFCIVAVLLKLYGVDHVQFDDGYFQFFMKVFQMNEPYTSVIPRIPEIPQEIIENSNDFIAILLNIGQGFFNVVNVISTILNVVIQMFMFMFNTLVAIVDGIREIVQNNGGSMMYIA